MYGRFEAPFYRKNSFRLDIKRDSVVCIQTTEIQFGILAHGQFAVQIFRAAIRGVEAELIDRNNIGSETLRGQLAGCRFIAGEGL